MKLILFVLTCSLASFSSSALPASELKNDASVIRQAKRPITKRTLVRALNEGKRQRKELATYTSLIKEYGVDFEVSEANENDIRRAASFLNERQQNELISVIRSSYQKSLVQLDANSEQTINKTVPLQASLLVADFSTFGDNRLIGAIISDRILSKVYDKIKGKTDKITIKERVNTDRVLREEALSVPDGQERQNSYKQMLTTFGATHILFGRVFEKEKSFSLRLYSGITARLIYVDSVAVDSLLGDKANDQLFIKFADAVVNAILDEVNARKIEVSEPHGSFVK